MFDFDSGLVWDVGKEADTLTQSLFGATKKKGKHKIHKNDENFAAAILDSDDEKYTKKGVKKLKKKEKRKKKQSERTVDTPVSEMIVESTVPVKTTKKEKLQKVKPKLSNETDSSQTINPRKQKKKSVKSENMDLAANIESGKLKRKFSEVYDNNTSISSGGKKIKLAAELSSTIPDESAKKRKRKKKNNSKKNKYAHLALNRKSQADISKEEVDADKSVDNKLISDKGQKKLKTSVADSVKEIKSFQVENGIGNTRNDKPKTDSDIGVKSLKRKKRKADTSGLSSIKSSAKLEIETEGQELGDQKSNITSNQKKIKEKATIEQIGFDESKKDLKSKRKGDFKKLEKDNGAKQHKNNVKANKAMHANNDKENSKSKQKQQRLQMIFSEAGNKDGNDKGTKKKKAAQLNFNSEKNDNSTDSTKATQKKTLGKLKSNSKNEGSSDPVKASSMWQNKTLNLQSQARQKLNAARFRFINEQMYKCSGKEALQMFQEDRAAFKVYHEGFENQAVRWPVNPVNILIKQMKDKPKNLIIADFGCGDAKLARNVLQKVHSFDLVALNKRVTACDMTKVPLPKESVDVAVFCLSLMGTNLDDYIREANRVLKDNGLLKIVEVVSRFQGPSSFIAGVCAHGFQLLNKRDVSEMFYLMDFRKVKSAKKTVSGKGLSLKPCVYKKR